MLMSKPSILNFLKKNYKNIIIILVLMLAEAFTLYVLLHKDSNKVTFYVPQHDYCLVSEVPTFNTLIYTSSKDTPYLDKEAISLSYLLDASSEDYYLVSITGIKSEESIVYDNVELYGYNLEVTVPFTTSEIVKFKNAYLKLEYINEEELSFKVGSVCLYNEVESDNSLGYSSLKGIYHNQNDTTMLGGVWVKLNNLNPITITKINALSVYASVDNTLTREGSETKEYVINDYPILDANKNIEEVSFDPFASIIINLKYNEVVENNTIGFVIDYVEDGVSKSQVISPFKFYQTSKAPVMEIYNYVYD